MSDSPRVALIVNTYNQPDYLRRVLNHVSRQTSPPEEILVADDGSGEETKAVFQQWASCQTVPASHLWQPHEEFRRAQILNRAISRAKSNYLVFLDGDTVPHPHFIRDHRALARPGAFSQGHRALIERRAATWFGLGALAADRRKAVWQFQCRGLKHAFRWPRPLVRQRNDLRGVRGCNLGLWRDDLVRVNGYNEAFVGWGREDSELALRLMNSGVRRLDARGWAVCYHLWHPPADRTRLGQNDELLAQAQRERSRRCHRGLDQYLVSLAS